VALWGRNSDPIGVVAERIGDRAVSVSADLTVRAEVARALAETSSALGHIDIFIANAGLINPTGVGASAAEWDESWRVHVTSVMQVVQSVLPSMLERGNGHIAVSASSASITLNPKSIVYSVTKRAQLAMMEWLVARYYGSGVKFSTFLPGGIDTPMHKRMQLGDPHSVISLREADTSAHAAAVFADGIEADQAVVYIKERTREDLRLRASDYEGWLEGLAQRFPDVPLN
jgi:NADP-dependent 3-hydroxy acid dehydrogenase YdfG